jgi:catechol 2,3-dioxygenase-like lactoylglutathione lyase family enzyme
MLANIGMYMERPNHQSLPPAVEATHMPSKIAPWAFVLAVRDLDRSARYFRDVLGFQVSWEDATDWRLVERDGVRVMLGYCPSDQPAADLGSHNLFGYLDVDRLRTELMERGAVCTHAIDQPYGMREMVVTTIDGHRIVFGQELKTANKAI